MAEWTVAHPFFLMTQMFSELFNQSANCIGPLFLNYFLDLPIHQAFQNHVFGWGVGVWVGEWWRVGIFTLSFQCAKRVVSDNLGLDRAGNQSCSSSSIFWGASYNDFWASTC